MSTNAISELLPESCVPFEAKKLKNPFAVWSLRPEYPLDKIVDQFGWLVPGSQDLDAVTTEGKEFYAERYGGSGIGSHGGGARCGLSGSEQIKGIGCNPLTSGIAPPDYSHGGLSLFECIQEAMWSVVYNHALPYGAADIVAIISTNTNCWWVLDRWGADALSHRYGSPPVLPRGMVIRSAALRPAHFERASLYVPGPHDRNGVREDVRRTASAINALLNCLHHSVPSDNEQDRLENSFVYLAKRYAMQSVAAKSKRLVHGNISSSNICLDGRWIDFGSSTAIPGWGAPCGYGPFWNDSEIYEQIFGNLAYGCSKYLPSKNIDYVQLTLKAIEAYRRVHDEWMTLRFISLLGFPLCVLSEFNSGDRTLSRLFSAVTNIMKVGAQGYLSPHPDDHATFGKYRMGDIFMSLVACDKNHQLEAVRKHIDSFQLADELIGAYECVKEECYAIADKQSVSISAFNRYQRLQVQKMSRMPEILYRENMVKATEDLVLGASSSADLSTRTAALINEVSLRSKLQLKDPEPWVVDILEDQSRVVSYDAASDEYQVTKKGLVKKISPTELSEKDLRQISAVTNIKMGDLL